jgi:very-short-patch-repair endonuclease
MNLCKCGCGKRVNNLYANGHWNKGLHKDDKRVRKMSQWKDPEARNKKISESLKGYPGTKGFLGKHFTEEQKKKISDSTRKGMTEEVREKCRVAAKKRWKNPEYRDAQVKRWAKGIEMKPNKLELKFDKFLQTNFPGEWKYVGDGQIWIAGKNPDFINVNGKKALIELFGNYFHKPVDEEVRKSHFKQFGFDTIVIWENEFLLNPDKVRQTVA